VPVDSASASRASTANTIRVQKLITEVRSQGMLPNDSPDADNGRAQAKRFAATIGVGDNLRAALQDLYTQDMPMAPSWTSRMSQDIVTGDGDIQPEHTSVKVGIVTAGLFESAGGTIKNASGLASLTSELIAESGTAAATAHRGGSTNSLFGG
jgi:hypothetical protein